MEIEEPSENTILGRWCGSQVPASHTSKGSQIRVRFISDEYFPSEPGFSIRYSLLPMVSHLSSEHTNNTKTLPYIMIYYLICCSVCANLSQRVCFDQCLYLSDVVIEVVTVWTFDAPVIQSDKVLIRGNGAGVLGSQAQHGLLTLVGLNPHLIILLRLMKNSAGGNTSHLRAPDHIFSTDCNLLLYIMFLTLFPMTE